jgi:hypothetical protein
MDDENQRDPNAKYDGFGNFIGWKDKRGDNGNQRKQGYNPYDPNSLDPWRREAIDAYAKHTGKSAPAYNLAGSWRPYDTYDPKKFSYNSFSQGRPRESGSSERFREQSSWDRANNFFNDAFKWYYQRSPYMETGGKVPEKIGYYSKGGKVVASSGTPNKWGRK